MDLQPCGRFDWERVVRRLVLPIPVKLVGFTLAQYGDVRGEGIRPGERRLAAVCCMGERTVRRHLDVYRSLGLVERLTHGGGRDARAALYRLTLPPDLLARVPMLDPDESVLMPYSGQQMAAVAPADPSPTPASVSAGVTTRYSGQSGPLLRPNPGSTPATQVAAYQETNQLTPRRTPPWVSTSPAPLLRPAADPDPPPDPEAERARQAAALDAWSASHLRPVPTDPTTRETA